MKTQTFTEEPDIQIQNLISISNTSFHLIQWLFLLYTQNHTYNEEPETTEEPDTEKNRN